MKVEKGDLVWWPTLRCQNRCAYCNARSLPLVYEQDELPPLFWRDFFARCPWKVQRMVVCGGEPTLYGGVEDIMGGWDWPTHINTNLARDPDESAGAGRTETALRQ